MGASSKMDFYQTPIYLIVFNRLDALRQLVDWLESSGYKNIHIIDNASTYPPLLQYLKSSPHTVHNMERNYGHLVLWESGEFDDVIDHHNFVLSDCDILPVESCPPKFWIVIRTLPKLASACASMIFRTIMLSKRRFWNGKRHSGITRSKAARSTRRQSILPLPIIGQA